MMGRTPCSADRPPSEASAAPDPGRAAQALLLELESSLGKSQRALLDRQVTSLEQRTEQQNSLIHCYLALPDAERASTPALAVVAARVRELGQIQIVLLARAQNRLRLLSHLTAGFDYDYAGLAAGSHPATKELCG